MFFRLHFFFLVVAALFLSIFFFARAENPFASITFPIPELGNCGSFDACKTYCDDLSHVDACVAYGKAHGLIKSEDAEKIKHLPKTGPGGCASEDGCKSYCADALHLDECIAFAEKNNLISRDDASRIKQFAAGGGPGGCKGAEECKNYCNDPAHIDECVSFAEKNGFISSQEAERVRALANKTGPGGCKRQACREYCNDPAHAEECIAFGEENGFISHDDALRAKKFIGKIGPGGCQGEQCREYCRDTAHQEECLKFAENNGLIKHDEAERAKKFMDASREGGPGGCRGEQCREYCGASEHRDECFQFAKDHDLITHEDEQSFEAGQKINNAVQEAGGPGGCKDEATCRQYCSDSSHIEECLAFAVAHGGISREQAEKMLKEFIRGISGQQRPPVPGEFKNGQEEQFNPQEDFQKFEQDHFDQFHKFENLEKKFRGSGFPGGPGGFPDGQGPAGFGESGDGQQFPTSGFTGGPGGCQEPQGCIKYCSDPANRNECAKFFQKQKEGPPPGALFKQVPSGSESGYHNPQPLLPSFVGPGGCTTQEECKAYCTDPAHRSECQFNPGGSSIPSGTPSGGIQSPPAGTNVYSCNSYDSCKAYCSDSSHQQEDVCVKFLQHQPQSRSDYFWGGFASLGKAALDLFR